MNGKASYTLAAIILALITWWAVRVAERLDKMETTSHDHETRITVLEKDKSKE